MRMRTTRKRRFRGCRQAAAALGMLAPAGAPIAFARAGPGAVPYRGTGGHRSYPRTLLSEGFDFDPRAPGRQAPPRSLAAAVGDRLRALPPQTRTILEMLSVLNLRMPLAQLGQAAQVESPSAAIEPAVASGLVDWRPEEPACPVVIRHPLVRDAIYAGITATRRRVLHARAVSAVSESASWEHRVAALDRPDEGLAAQLERLAGEEAVGGRLALAATHLLWACDVSPARADRERRLLTAALHLTLAEESRGLALREAVEASAPSPLRSCVLGTMAFSSGQLAEAERQFSQALAEARTTPDSRSLATHIPDLHAYCYLALAQYLAGAWDDVLLTAEQGFSAAAIHSRRYELPLLHLAAGCVPAGRGAAGEAERHARLAEEAAASLDYGQERLYAAMARTLVCQASADYLGMADALGYWQDAVLDGRTRLYAVLWRPLLAEGLIGSGQLEQAAAVLDQLRAEHGQAGYLQPALAWLEGWLAEQRGAPEQARRIYARGEESASAHSPVYTARLLLAHGRLLRRTGNRKDAVERLRRADELYTALRAAPFIARTEEELAACHLPGSPAKKQPVLALTSRETEVAHLVGKGLSNPEVAAELFISRKAVEYHLGNIYAKCGLQGRQQLRRFVEQWRQPAAA